MLAQWDLAFVSLYLFSFVAYAYVSAGLLSLHHYILVLTMSLYNTLFFPLGHMI